MGGRGRYRRKVEQLPCKDSIARQTIRVPDGLYPYTKTLIEREQRITRPDSVPRSPAKRRTTGPWSGADIQSMRQIDLLIGIDRRCAQAVCIHQHELSNAGSYSQTVECFSLPHGISNPVCWW